MKANFVDLNDSFNVAYSVLIYVCTFDENVCFGRSSTIVHVNTALVVTRVITSVQVTGIAND